MSFGKTGNGFDKLLDPYRFGGKPVSVTSVPYPVQVEEELDAVVEGAFDVEVVALLEEIEGSSRALDGTLRSTLIVYSEGPDSLDSISASALSGSIATVLRVINADMEELDSVIASATGGTIARILIQLNVDEGDLDALNSVHARATGGTLS